ncbi:GNAT family N-acetyltransferase [Galactobacter valiniphilus]|uniref:N-acetyltransferase n=1 Tax=Galactobacter valiniphilus TaxID=2676122 RepID=A0A399JBQ2_9MICC|nr:GNAT family N-acetyltransferase [Galactobacter valiniphilus]RII42480.1 N-acetyltransferase [Galactobacter valiniphilus]
MAWSVGAGEVPRLDECVELYDAVGWSAYTRDPQALQAALAGSTRVYTVRDGRRLVALARTLSDGASVTLVQDLLVHPDCQREGLGSLLLDAIHEDSTGIRQLLLMTDDEPAQRAFYESNGLTEVHELPRPGRAFVRYL